MNSRPSLLYPLDDFYAQAGRPLPRVEPLAGEEVPEPYRSLLVHDHDMTPTLEAFFGETIHLRLLQRRVDGEAMARQVALTLDESGRPVEFGAIVIHFERFPEEAKELVLGCRCPLGTILARHQIRHESCPRAFFRVQSDPLMEDALGLERSCTLFGRRNVLASPEGWVVAEVVEILPPLE